MRRRIATDAQYMHDLIVDSQRAIDLVAANCRGSRMRRWVALLIDLTAADANDRRWVQRYGARPLGRVAVGALTRDDAIALIETTNCPGGVLLGDMLHNPPPTGRIHVVAYSSVVRTLLLAPVPHIQPTVNVIHRGPEKDGSARVRTTVTYDIPEGPRRSRRLSATRSTKEGNRR